MLNNGDFEQPLGPTNWTLLNLAGVPDDFDIKDRTKATAVGGSLYGLTFRPLTLRLTHACLTQTVTNLTLDHVYTVSGWMIQGWWEGTNNAKRDKYLVFIEAIGGQGAPTADGRASVIATTPPDADVDAPYTYPTAIWRQFTAQQTPDANGRIEVRLHYKKVSGVTYDKTWIMGAGFDDLALTPNAE